MIWTLVRQEDWYPGDCYLLSPKGHLRAWCAKGEWYRRQEKGIDMREPLLEMNSKEISKEEAAMILFQCEGSS